MMHPLLHLILTQPQLLADHVEAYAELLGSELVNASTAWKKRAILISVALCCLGVAAVLAGVALMLWAVIPASHIQAPWALVAAPLLPMATAMWCLMAVRKQDRTGAFDNLRRQMSADMMMWREWSGA
jgi:cytochrome bd-type quinol oxidase subunit 2